MRLHRCGPWPISLSPRPGFPWSVGLFQANQLDKVHGDVVGYSAHPAPSKLEVVPYQGPNIQDDFIHRIFFRIYEQPHQAVASMEGEGTGM